LDDESIFNLLNNRQHPPEDQLPDTGVGMEWERILSPLFIESDIYGTRSSSVIRMGKEEKHILLNAPLKLIKEAVKALKHVYLNLRKFDFSLIPH